MLAQQRDQCGRADDAEHEHQALGTRYLDVPTEATDDGGDAHEAAVGVQGGDSHLAEGDAEVEQRGRGTGAAETHDVGDLTAGELTIGHGRGEHAEHHRHLGADHRAEASGEEGLHG
ncbi:hypothetical protein D9M71_381220 [compost metagenome]